MPDVTVACLSQKACYWACSGTNRNGRPTVSSTPVQVKCRWEQNNTSQVTENGTTLGFPITVHLDREVLPKSIMRLGALADLPATLNNLFEVQSCDCIPDLKNRPNKSKYTAVLTKFGSTLPS